MFAIRRGGGGVYLFWDNPLSTKINSTWFKKVPFIIGLLVHEF